MTDEIDPSVPVHLTRAGVLEDRSPEPANGSWSPSVAPSRRSSSPVPRPTASCNGFWTGPMTTVENAMDLLAAFVMDNGSRFGDIAHEFQWDCARAVLDPDAPPSRWESRPARC